MESFSLMFYLEVGLFVLLMVCLVYMVSINKKLKLLKSGGDGFKAVVVELSHATENAQNAIQGLKLTVRDAEHGLDGNLKQARSVAEELKYLISQAGGHASGFQNENPRNLPLPSDNLKHVQQPVVAQNKAKNFADQTLEKVSQRHQSLPNPIVHSQEQRLDNNAAEVQNLGQNIPVEHREIALQRREQALKSIAAKNIENNNRRPAARPTNRQPAMRQRPVAPVAPAAQNVRAQQGAAPQMQNAPRPNAQRPVAQNPEMSLSDMVGRHAELERQNFAEETNSSGEVASREGVADKRQGLFQKLSRTR